MYNGTLDLSPHLRCRLDSRRAFFLINFEKTQLKKIKNPIENTMKKIKHAARSDDARPTPDYRCHGHGASREQFKMRHLLLLSLLLSSRKSTQKVQSHGSGRPTQLSRPSWFPLSRGYCFSWCAKQKRHQRTNARSCAQEVGESLRRVFGCHSVSAFRKKSPQRKIIVSSFSFKTIVIFSILLPN